jgi:hypothetical protein
MENLDEVRSVGARKDQDAARKRWHIRSSASSHRQPVFRMPDTHESAYNSKEMCGTCGDGTDRSLFGPAASTNHGCCRRVVRIALMHLAGDGFRPARVIRADRAESAWGGGPRSERPWFPALCPVRGVYAEPPRFQRRGARRPLLYIGKVCVRGFHRPVPCSGARFGDRKYRRIP